MENICKFSQGTIWQWTPEGEIQYNEGVQAGPRPVLIISNNTFNVHSSSVNCLTITSVLKDSPVHVPIHLSVVSHIQCEQVQTVPKKELSEFKGVVSSETMSEVKEKIRFQFNMSESKTPEPLRAVDNENRLLNLNSQIKQESIVDRQESYSTRVLNDILSSVTDIKNEFAELIKQYGVGAKVPYITPAVDTVDEGSASNVVAEKNTSSSGRPRRGRKTSAQKKEKEPRRKYTDDDKAFIIDENNSLDDLINKYDFRNRETAYKVRYYFKRTSAQGQAQNETLEEADAPVGEVIE